MKVEAGPSSPTIPVYELSVITWGCKLYFPMVIRDEKVSYGGDLEQEGSDASAQAQSVKGIEPTVPSEIVYSSLQELNSPSSPSHFSPEVLK